MQVREAGESVRWTILGSLPFLGRPPRTFLGGSRRKAYQEARWSGGPRARPRSLASESTGPGRELLPYAEAISYDFATSAGEFVPT